MSEKVSAPLLASPRPEFGNEYRLVGLIFVKCVDCLNSNLVSIKCRPVFGAAACQQFLRLYSVCRVKRYVNPKLTEHIPDRLDIIIVIGETSVFILDRNRDNRTAVCRKIRYKLTGKPLVISAQTRHIFFVQCTNLHIFFFDKPIRQAAEIPFRTHIR